jgi:phage major head subunit gpT-like protein
MAYNNVALYADVASHVRHQVMDAVEAATPFFPRLAITVESSTDIEDYDWLGAFPQMREWLGDRKFHQLGSSEFSIKNRTWENGIQLPKEKIDDGKTGYFDRLADGLATEASYHPDELLVETMELAEEIRCFDGGFFFDTNHVYGDSGVQSNIITVAVVDPDNPTPAECKFIVNSALTAFRGFKRDNGKPYMRPSLSQIDDLLAVYPHTYDNNFKEAYESQLVLVTNAAGTAGGAVDNHHVVVPSMLPLTERTGRYVDLYRMGTMGGLSPFVYQDRQPLGWAQKGQDDREFKYMKVFGDARYNVGVLAWWKAVRVKLVAA